MASKRKLRRRSCEGKQKLSRSDAIRHAAISRRHGLMIAAYKCKFCKHWHVGHPNKRIIQSIKAKARAKKKLSSG